MDESVADFRFLQERPVSSQPMVCRPEAFRSFALHLETLQQTESLWRAAAAVSMHALDHVSLDSLDDQFSDLAERVRSGSRSGSSTARLAHLHEVLFHQDGFSGNTHNYYSSLNSYLPAVLESREGIPILLALIYKVVGERVGLRIEGLNTPGHFLVRVFSENRWLIIDPFFRGQALSRPEALDRIRELSGRSFTGSEESLSPANHHQWLTRILSNLENVFAAEGRQRDLTAMSELKRLLWDSL